MSSELTTDFDNTTAMMNNLNAEDHPNNCQLVDYQAKRLSNRSRT